MCFVAFSSFFFACGAQIHYFVSALKDLPKIPSALKIWTPPPTLGGASVRDHKITPFLKGTSPMAGMHLPGSADLLITRGARPT